ncbi:ABC1 kinase family protein [Sandaracinus amylolyticus]|nr:AarF/ABC1/UbiB kinase family protein [Sandaracinus amylolyticus]
MRSRGRRIRRAASRRPRRSRLGRAGRGRACATTPRELAARRTGAAPAPCERRTIMSGSGDDESRALPTGRLGRFARLAALGARSGAGLVVSRDRGRAVAAHAAEVLGTMRGLAAKIGQMASYVDGFVPDAHHVAFEEALSTLRDATATTPFEAVRELVERELGAPLRDLYASFDERPFASASIGQVHRATLHDGREVAVKLQHPGIERAIAADLDNASVIEPLVRAMGGAKVDSARIFREVRERFEEELDYTREAAHQRAFARAFASDPQVVIPSIVDERSSRRVMTSEYVHGARLEDGARAAESERSAWARTLWAFTFTSILRDARFNADPHPGNFLLQPEGRVAFLDFGCVQPLDLAHVTSMRDMHRAAIARDEALFARACATLLGARGGSYERVMVGYTRLCYEPLFASPFRITRPYAAEVVRRTQEMKQEIFFAKDGSTVPLPSGMLFVNRLQFGFYSVLARLECEVDYAALEAPLLAS